MKKGEILDTNLLPFMCNVPENTIELTITAKILNDDGTTNVAVSVLKFSEVREGFIKGDEWADENAVYCLTDKAMAEMENEDGTN